MATALLRSLPAARAAVEEDDGPDAMFGIAASMGGGAGPQRPSFQVPPYGARQSFVPRKAEHFGDGGAFPECAMAQYPLGLGKDDASGAGGGGAIVPMTVDQYGKASFDGILKQGSHSTGSGAIVHSSHSELLPKLHEITEDALKRPDAEELAETKRRTQLAIGKVVDYKLSGSQINSVGEKPGAPTYIKYTPSGGGGAHNSGASHRVIRMSEVQVDPLEPPKFRHKKVPRGPGSPPVPVLHSPPRALTKEDQADWKIPPCISNWKNAKGYTIPLDKRLAADGRGLQEVQINDNFAKLSEAMYVAEQKAREAVETRSKIQKELMLKEKERKEDELRALAQRARLERSGGGGGRDGSTTAYPPPPPVVGGGAGGGGGGPPLPGPPPLPTGMASGGGGGGHRERGEAEGERRESREEREERRRRDELREDRRQEREKERRLEERGHGGKKSKLTRDRDRDVSELQALGKANVSAKSNEAMYDQRLFNQDEGLASGFGADDSYGVYDKGLFAEKASKLYTGRGAGDDDEGGDGAGDRRGGNTERFKADKGFAGTEGGGGGGGGRGAAPVQFEQDKQEADPFGLDAFLTEVKGKGKR